MFSSILCTQLLTLTLPLLIYSNVTLQFNLHVYFSKMSTASSNYSILPNFSLLTLLKCISHYNMPYDFFIFLLLSFFSIFPKMLDCITNCFLSDVCVCVSVAQACLKQIHFEAQADLNFMVILLPQHP